jgi:hypothetical protein
MRETEKEHIYKYYIQHGMSCYLTASKDPSDPCIWIVNLKKTYTPGTGCQYAAVCSGPTNKSTCQVSSNFTGFHSFSELDYFGSNSATRPVADVSARMCTAELEKLMATLNRSSGMLRGQVILY